MYRNECVFFGGRVLGMDVFLIFLGDFLFFEIFFVVEVVVIFLVEWLYVVLGMKKMVRIICKLKVLVMF